MRRPAHAGPITATVGLVGDAPQLLHTQSAKLLLMGDTAWSDGDRGMGGQYWAQAAELQLRVLWKPVTWVDEAVELGERLIRAVDATALTVPDVCTLLRRLASGLQEVVDLEPADSLSRMRPVIGRFHSAWLQFVLKRATHEIPAVLASIQGRKIAALLLDTMDTVRAVTDPGLSPGAAAKRAQFLAARTELRRIALALQNDVAGSVPADGAVREEPTHAISDRRRRLYEELQSRRERYDQLRLQISLERQLAVLTPQLDVSKEKLLGSLAGDEALLLLLEGPSEPPGGPRTSYGWLLTGGGQDDHLMSLPGLSAVAARMHDPVLMSPGSHRAVYTDDRARPTGAAAPIARADIDRALWTDVGPRLQGKRRVHVITQGALHLLPIATWPPEGMQVYLYPGLVFYWMQRLAKRAVLSTKFQPSVALAVHDAASIPSYEPIPFVHAEASLVGPLWPCSHSPPKWHQSSHVDVLHLAAHGHLRPNGAVSLVLGTQERFGVPDVLGSALRAEIVYLSACLVGRTTEDLDGDPLGLLSAFFMRDTRCVIASLMPVNDFYAPLMALLFHRTLRWRLAAGKGLDAHEALAQAKCQLREGRWSPVEAPDPITEETATIKAFRRGYAPQVRACLAVALQSGKGAEQRKRVVRLLERWVPRVEGGAWTDQISLAMVDDHDLDQGTEKVLDRLIDLRSQLDLHPGVQGLLHYLHAFGAPEVGIRPSASGHRGKDKRTFPRLWPSPTRAGAAT